ncbi:MAG: serine protease [Patescibacteria group bacterium]
MSFLTDLIVAVLAGYLAFTNFLADGLLAIYPSEDASVAEVEQVETTILDELAKLPSRFDDVIPDILLKNNAYQQATVIGSEGFTGATTDDPLEALVNVFCTLTTDEYIRTTTGTGFFIDPDGIIMTNAHVAQFLLLEETDSFGEADCTIRTGTPAAPEYQAELLYLPPAWVVANASVLNDVVPLGTGERDYALLYVSARVDEEPLPAKFPALDFDSELLPVSTKDEEVVAAGYPAADLIKYGPSADLLPKKALTTVSELYTFGSNYADVFSIRGSDVGVEGASGGPIVNTDGEVIGMIVTRGDDELDGSGSLRAITLSHVDRTILQETGFSLAENLNGNLAFRSQIFAETLAPFLVGILEENN